MTTQAQKAQIAMAYNALTGLPHQVLRTIILDTCARNMTPDQMEALGHRIADDAWHIMRGDNIAKELAS